MIINFSEDSTKNASKNASIINVKMPKKGK